MGPLWRTISPTLSAGPRRGSIATLSPITHTIKISPSPSSPTIIASKSGIGPVRNAIHPPAAIISNNEMCWLQP